MYQEKKVLQREREVRGKNLWYATRNTLRISIHTPTVTILIFTLSNITYT